MTKPLLPFHERVNIPSQLRAMRDNLRALETKEVLTPAEALKKQRLQQAIAKLIKSNVYLVSDNTSET